MLLIGAILVLTAVMAAGAWLASAYLLLDAPPGRPRWSGLAHGLAGMGGLALLVTALRAVPDQQAARMGAGGFGRMAAALVAGALLAGLLILLTLLRRRAVPTALVATHGLLGVTGVTLLWTYLTMRR